MTAPERYLTAAWRVLVLLVPITLLAPIAGLTWALVQLGPAAGNPFTQISIFFGLLALGALAFLLTIGVIAAVFALRGRPGVALVVLGVISIFLLPIAFLPGSLRVPLIWLVALPGALAFVAALIGFLQHRHAHRGLAIAVAILLALPVVTVGVIRGSVAFNNARGCPAGPGIDITVSGQESEHFSRACGLPLSGTELTGCRFGIATIGLPTWDGPWFLDLSASGRGTVTSEKTQEGPSLLVGFNQSYGGPYGWRGYYRVDGPCRGYIDADLYSQGPPVINLTVVGPGPPVHVKGIWETPIVS